MVPPAAQHSELSSRQPPTPSSNARIHTRAGPDIDAVMRSSTGAWLSTPSVKVISRSCTETRCDPDLAHQSLVLMAKHMALDHSRSVKSVEEDAIDQAAALDRIDIIAGLEDMRGVHR
jgi:hypothetical protein